MTCNECEIVRARSSIGPVSTTCPKCIYCAARRIQFIQRRMQIGKAEKVNRCREALQEAINWGHAEDKVRQLAKLDVWAVEPARKGK